MSLNNSGKKILIKNKADLKSRNASLIKKNKRTRKRLTGAGFLRYGSVGPIANPPPLGNRPKSPSRVVLVTRFPGSLASSPPPIENRPPSPKRSMGNRRNSKAKSPRTPVTPVETTLPRIPVREGSVLRNLQEKIAQNTQPAEKMSLAEELRRRNASRNRN